MKYHVKGAITYTVRVWVDQECEGDDPDTILEELTNDYAPLPDGPLDVAEYDSDDLEITEAEEDPIGEDVRLRRMGAAMLPGF